MWLLEVFIEGLLEWLFQARSRWLWLPLGVLILAVGVVVMNASMPAGIAIAIVGVGALLYGVLSGIFEKGDE